jgi:hypothetical protein
MKKTTTYQTSEPDFVAENCPRHKPLEELQALTDPEKFKRMSVEEYHRRLNELGKPRAQLISGVHQPKTLIEMYNITPQQIYQDTLDRPSHYTNEQIQLAEARFFGRLLPIEPTREQLDDLFYRWMERTEQTQRRQEIIRKVTDISDVAEFEEDQKETHGKTPTYEDQNFDGLIKII